MRDIISQPQADLLGVLTAFDTDKSELIKLTSIHPSTFRRAMLDLRERGLIEAYMPAEKKAMLYAITMAGRRALVGHIRHHEVVTGGELTKAQPARRNPFEFPVYVPPTNGYVRNGGNKHIQSRGMSV